MADQLQLRGGTTLEHSTFTGVLREVTVDTTKKTLVVHDNVTPGGVPLAKESALSSEATARADADTALAQDIADEATARADADTEITEALSGQGAYAIYGGTANAIELTSVRGAQTAYTTGQQFRFRATATNTGAMTINVDGLGAKTVKTVTGADTPAGYIRTDVDTVVSYDGTNFVAQPALIPTTSETDTTAGRLLKVGDFGVGSLSNTVGAIFNDTAPFPRGFFRGKPNDGSPLGGTSAAIIQFSAGLYDTAAQIYSNWSGDEIYFRRYDGTEWQPGVEFYHTGNTIVDSNGFIKEA